jgi:hypothetical protein
MRDATILTDRDLLFKAHAGKGELLLRRVHCQRIYVDGGGKEAFLRCFAVVCTGECWDRVAAPLHIETGAKPFGGGHQRALPGTVCVAGTAALFEGSRSRVFEACRGYGTFSGRLGEAVNAKPAGNPDFE